MLLNDGNLEREGQFNALPALELIMGAAEDGVKELEAISGIAEYHEHRRNLARQARGDQPVMSITPEVTVYQTESPNNAINVDFARQNVSAVLNQQRNDDVQATA